MFFESWSEILRIVVTTIIIYPFLIVTTNVLGKRSFAKMNNFDWIVTIAIGSILGSAILLTKVVIFEVLTAVSLLLLLQFILTWLCSRFTSVDSLINTPPELVFYNGKFLREAIKDARLTEAEIESSVRDAGFGDLSGILAVEFESDGEMSVIRTSEGPNGLLAILK